MKLTAKSSIKYENKWVAVDDENQEIRAVADSIGELEEKLLREKIKYVSLLFLTPFKQSLTPVCQ